MYDWRVPAFSSIVEDFNYLHRDKSLWFSDAIWRRRFGLCLTTATWRCRKNFSQWECSFHWKLRWNWLEFLRQHQIAVVRQGPGWTLAQALTRFPDGAKPPPAPIGTTYHKSCGIHLRAILLEMLKLLVIPMCSKMTHFKLPPYLLMGWCTATVENVNSFHVSSKQLNI